MVFDVEAELVGHHSLRAQVVDVLHHQSPGRQDGASGSAFQHFDEERFRVVCDVACEFTHLIGCAHIGVFVGNGQDVVHLQSAREADVSEGIVDGIFAAGELSCCLELLVVDAAVESVYAVEDVCGLRDVASL